MNNKPWSKMKWQAANARLANAPFEHLFDAPLLTNIDDVRAEIMRLDVAEMFDQAAWDRVQVALIEQDRPAALADAQRRMDMARLNAAVYIIGVDWERGESGSPVAVETEEPIHAK